MNSPGNTRGVQLNKYTFTRQADPASAIDMINASGYYGTILGLDVVGAPLFGVENEDGALVACVVVIHNGPQAYLDYLCVALHHQNKGLAAYLLNEVRLVLVACGVRILHTCVSGENGASMKLLTQHDAKIGWPYVNGVIHLEENDG